MVGAAVAGAAIGVAGAISKNRANKKQAKYERQVAQAQAQVAEAQFNAQKKSDLFQADMAKANASLKATGQLGDLARQSQAANRALADKSAEAAGQGSAALAAAGMSGVKNSGSSALARSVAEESAARGISEATEDVNAGTASATMGIAAERAQAFSAAQQVVDAYAKGGSADLVREAQIRLSNLGIDYAKGQEKTANSFGFQALSILSGGLSGASSGLSIYSNLQAGGLFAPKATSLASGGGAGFGLAGVDSAAAAGRTIDWSRYRG